jgi:hypothetical protein
LEGIQELDFIVEGRVLTEDEKRRKEDMSNEFEKVILLEEMSWRWKSRALWLSEGDKNSNDFHRVANSH